MFDWSGEIVADWLERGHPHMTGGLDLVPSERGTLVSETALNRRFNRYCEDLDLGLSPGLDIHSLRRSYITHVIEAGMDPLFVQHQAGHNPTAPARPGRGLVARRGIRPLQQVIRSNSWDCASTVFPAQRAD